VIGLSFLAPIPYFFLRRRLSPRSSLALLGIGTLIGCQGGMGWYMVKSGLDEAKVKELGGVPRVSQYRLAAHLGLAFLVYSACVRLSLGVGRDWKIINGGSAAAGTGLGGWKGVGETLSKLNAATVGRTRVLVTALTGLIWFTAISGESHCNSLQHLTDSPFRCIRRWT
jgi:cytochrome c oxidase assembly protein subunit 15